MKEILDIVYRETSDGPLMMDLFLPQGVDNPPLILWIHGGAWQIGDRKWCLLKRQADRGYAVASVDYRLSGTAIFPAQIVDCKEALLFLRANAAQYGYDGSRVAVGGDSAGGHLAALMGTSAGHSHWEPEGADCAVQAVVDFYGPTAFWRDWPNARKDNSPEACLIGAPATSMQGRMLAAAASPLTYVDGKEPPFLILHGDCDDTVPYSQSLLLRNALEKAGVSVAMHRVFGGGHGFDSPAANAVVDAFLDRHLMQTP